MAQPPVPWPLKPRARVGLGLEYADKSADEAGDARDNACDDVAARFFGKFRLGTTSPESVSRSRVEPMLCPALIGPPAAALMGMAFEFQQLHLADLDPQQFETLR